MDMRSYIGITDFTSFEQVKQMLDVFRRYRVPGSRRMLHVGIMMSYKTLNGIETKWSKAFPPKEKIAHIFDSVEGREDLYYCLHYADYGSSTRAIDLGRAIELAGYQVNALQLDMPWPEPGIVANGVHMSRRQIEVILQVSSNAIEQAGGDPAGVVQRLGEYDGIVHRVLLDKSMGRGIGMDAQALIPFARAIKEKFPYLGIGAAGGLGPGGVYLVAPLLGEFPDVSIDAQGKLRPSGNALDPIDWTMAGNYLAEALKLLK